jgi:DNA-binding NtrC family response regulator
MDSGACEENSTAAALSKPVLVRHKPCVVEDEDLAAQSTATVLITASTAGDVETLARRIHMASASAAAPFVLVRTAWLPSEPRRLRVSCSALLDAANGGSVLLSDVEEMPLGVQRVFFDVLAELRHERPPSAAVRLMSGTTVSLTDRIARGTFVEGLFYRLNVIHLMAEENL